MWIFGKSKEKTQERAIRQEAKVLMKQLIEAGMERAKAKAEIEMLLTLKLEAYQQSKAYEKSKSKILFAQMLIEKLLEELLENEDASYEKENQLTNESSIQKSMVAVDKTNQNKVNRDEEVRERLRKLTIVLAEVFHECTIREDDRDFKLTCDYFNNIAETYEASGRLMLQSELENLHYLLGDILQWKAPDFPALAYFCKFEDKSRLGELSNDRRNEILIKYYKESYWNELGRKLLAVGMKYQIEIWMQKNI